MVRILGRPLRDYPKLELSGKHDLESLSNHAGDAYLEDAVLNEVNLASYFNLLPHSPESLDEGDLDLATALVGAWSVNDIKSLKNMANILFQIRQEREKLEEAILHLREITRRIEHAIQALASNL